MRVPTAVSVWSADGALMSMSVIADVRVAREDRERRDVEVLEHELDLVVLVLGSASV